MVNGDLQLVGIITRALREKFGDTAIKVARFQVEHATEESLTTWRAVVRALSMH